MTADRSVCCLSAGVVCCCCCCCCCIRMLVAGYKLIGSTGTQKKRSGGGIESVRAGQKRCVNWIWVTIWTREFRQGSPPACNEVSSGQSKHRPSWCQGVTPTVPSKPFQPLSDSESAGYRTETQDSPPMRRKRSSVLVQGTYFEFALSLGNISFPLPFTWASVLCEPV